MKSRFEQPRRARMFRCRCRHCEARVTLERHPADYRRRFSCGSCGRSSEHRDNVLRVDWYRTSKAELKRDGVCECMRVPFPHRPGSRFKSSRCDGLVILTVPRRARQLRVAA